MKWLLTLISFQLVAQVLCAQDQPQVRATCTALVNGIKYKATCRGDEKITVKDGKGNVVLKIDPYDSGFEDFRFIDFDGDGYKDLLVEYMTNVPAICNLFIYNKQHRQFVRIDGFDRYPAPLRIRGTKVFYSYHRSGCADNNWDSDLFIIKNYKPVKLGNISGNECGDSGIKDGIYIHKVKDNKETLYKKMPISIINSYKNHKWGFIAQYWKNHYKEFISN